MQREQKDNSKMTNNPTTNSKIPFPNPPVSILYVIPRPLVCNPQHAFATEYTISISVQTAGDSGYRPNRQLGYLVFILVTVTNITSYPICADYTKNQQLTSQKMGGFWLRKLPYPTTRLGCILPSHSLTRTHTLPTTRTLRPRLTRNVAAQPDTQGLTLPISYFKVTGGET